MKKGDYSDQLIFLRRSNTFQLDEDRFTEFAQDIAFIFLEVVLIKNFSKTKPQIKYMKINYFDFYYNI